jgi:hypothetical protein
VLRDVCNFVGVIVVDVAQNRDGCLIAFRFVHCFQVSPHSVRVISLADVNGLGSGNVGHDDHLGKVIIEGPVPSIKWIVWAFQ